MENNEQHALNIENCKKITATAIDGVEAFSPTQITLSYAGGKIIVNGNQMKITAFTKTGGQFSALGNITGVKYTGKAAGLRQKLFK